MPYYGEALPYYYGGPFSNHSSLMTGTGRTLHSPLGSTRYAPHLTTISETPLSALRRYGPTGTGGSSTMTSRPRRVIDTADIDVSTPRALSSSHNNENQRNRLRRDRPTIRIRSQALKDNPALREHNERHEKTVGELLVEKFLIKDKKPEAEAEFRTKLYTQVSLENDWERKKREEMQEAIQRRVTRRMTRRRSSADVHIDPEQLKREVLIAQAQADVLDTLVAEEQAEIEVETRMGTLIRKNFVRTPRARHELETLSGDDQDEARSKKIAKKVKKRKKTTDKPSPPRETGHEAEDLERTKKVCKDNRRETKDKSSSILDDIDKSNKLIDEKLIEVDASNKETRKDSSKVEEDSLRIVKKLPKMEDKSFPNIEDEFPAVQDNEGETSPRGLKFKVEASNSVGDFSTLWINANARENDFIDPPAGIVEQFRDSVRLPAPPSKLGKIRKETIGKTDEKAHQDPCHDEIVVLPVKKTYVKDETRNSVYLTLKTPKSPGGSNKMAPIGRITKGRAEESIEGESARENSATDEATIKRQAKINKVAKFRSKDNTESDAEVRSISVSVAGSQGMTEAKDGGTKKLSGHVDNGSSIVANESIASENFGRDATPISQRFCPKISSPRDEKTKPIVSQTLEEISDKKKAENKREDTAKKFRRNDSEISEDISVDKIVNKVPVEKVGKLHVEKIGKVSAENETDEKKIEKVIKRVKKETNEVKKNTSDSVNKILPSLIPIAVSEDIKGKKKKIEKITLAISPLTNFVESLPNAPTVAKIGVIEENRVFGEKDQKTESEVSEKKSADNFKVPSRGISESAADSVISEKVKENGVENKIPDKKLKKKVSSDVPRREKNVAQSKLPKNRLLLGKVDNKVEPDASSAEVVSASLKNQENGEKECSCVATNGDNVSVRNNEIKDSSEDTLKKEKSSEVKELNKSELETGFLKKAESPSGRKEEEIDFWGEIESVKEEATKIKEKAWRKDNISANCISGEAEKKVGDSMVMVLESEPKACLESGPARLVDTTSLEEKKLSKVKKKKKTVSAEGSAGKKKDSERAEPTILEPKPDEAGRRRSADRLESKSEPDEPSENFSKLSIGAIDNPEIGKLDRNLSTIIEENLSPEAAKTEPVDPLAAILAEQEKIKSKLDTSEELKSSEPTKKLETPEIESPNVTVNLEPLNQAVENLESSNVESRQVTKTLESSKSDESREVTENLGKPSSTETPRVKKNIVAPLDISVSLSEIETGSPVVDNVDKIGNNKSNNVCTTVPEIKIVAPSSPTNVDSPVSFDSEVVQEEEEEEEDEPGTPTNETITERSKNISKWQGLTDLSLDEPSKEIGPEVTVDTGKKESGKKKIGSSKKTSKKSSSKSSSAQDSSKKKKLGKKKKSLTKDGKEAVKKLEESSGSKISNSSDTTLKPGGPIKRISPGNSGRNSPKQRPLELIKMFYTTPASLLTATPRDLSKVRRAKIKKRKHSSRTASASSDSTGSTRSTQSTTTTESTGSNDHDEDPGHKRVSSTRSNDSGFDGSPRLSNCDMACHKKCEKLTGNLCGLNQKLVAEALQSLKRAPSQSSDNQRNSDGSDHHASGRITPPATNLPRFKKYTVTDFNFLKVLGKGSFGKVLLAELRRTDCVYAVKCLKKDVVLEDDDVECTLIERKVLTLATRHPYLCHLFCTFQTDSHLFFVMEYLNGGDLMFHIQKSGRFAESRARFYAAEIWSGLNFLHKKGIVYRDLKLDNVLLDFEGHIRIADFGMCKLQIFLDRTADTFCGTPDYMAPEIIQGMKYNQAVDWWSFGVLLYEMLTGQSPFSGCDEDELFWSICNERPFIPRYLSQEAMDVLVCLLEKDAGKRPPAHEIAVHPFFHSLHWDRLERRQLEPPFKPALEHTLDTRYFDTAFTAERPRLTPVPEQILTSMDQSVFRGFSYTNPNATD